MIDRPTVAGLRAFKGRRQIITMHAYRQCRGSRRRVRGRHRDVHRRSRCETSGNSRRRPGVFLQAGHEQRAIHDETRAIREGFGAIECGADAIDFAGSLRIVEAMSREGIPVSGHVGYVPR